MEKGKLEAIWVKRMRFGPMDAKPTAELVAGRGIVDNADQGRKRQVTIISQEVWQRVMQELGSDLDPATRRANLMVSGVELARTHGKVLRIGDCRIRIYNQTTPCHRMDEALPGLKEALRPNWGGGAFGEVLDHGKIAVGDAVSWES